MLERLCFLLLCSIPSITMGASIHQWYQEEQPYVKLSIAESGWYTYTEAALQNVGFPVYQDSLAYLQLYKNGVEVPIQLRDSVHGFIIAFYGEKNEGTLEKELYKYDADPLHSGLSLYTDTAAYFLTYGTVKGRRVKEETYFQEALEITTARNHLGRTMSRFYTEDYSAGAIYPMGSTYTNGVILTDYDIGEGYCSKVIDNDQVYQLAIPLPNRSVESPQTQVAITFVGRSAGQHEVQVQASDQPTPYTLTIDNYAVVTLPCTFSVTADTVIIQIKVIGAVSLVKTEWYYRQTMQSWHTEEEYLFSIAIGEEVYVPADSTLLLYDINHHVLINTHVPRLLRGGKVVWKSKKTKEVPKSALITFAKNKLAETQYLMIYHELISSVKPKQTDAIQDFARYRASSEGGGYRVSTLDIEEVYNRFSYGVRTPQAIRNLINQYAKADLQFVLLVGRSKDPQVARFSRQGWKEDLIPNAGWPGSDIALAMKSFQEPIPQVAIGRLFVSSPTQAAAYFRKVKRLEAQPRAAPWRNRIMHLSGGYSDAEREVFATYIDSFTQQLDLSERYFNVSSIYKTTNEPQQLIDISSPINEGVALVTLFGHSSLTETDLDFGYVTDTTFGYTNLGKYPAFWLNGCASGNMYFRGTTVSTDWVNAVDKGAVLFVAHSHNGAVPGLKRYTDALYKVLADTHFVSKPFGTIMKEAASRYLTQYPWLTDIITVQQMNLQGDPAIRLFPSQLPDFVVDSSALAVSLKESNAAITIKVRNNGYPWQGEIEVELNLADQKGTVYRSVQKVAYVDKDGELVTFHVPMQYFWGNDFALDVTVDQQALIEEETKFNNSFNSIVSLPKLELEYQVYIKPNPVDEYAVLCVSVPSEAVPINANLLVYDVRGNVLEERLVSITNTYQEIQIAVGSYPQGHYFYQLQLHDQANAKSSYQTTGKIIRLQK